ncbi:MAG TPA: hypothetical protein VMA77_15835 [Solirubrobacteraceae bacterium]|nr:hypothetical protein [Solirubrobacteraceae bacterium]
MRRILVGACVAVGAAAPGAVALAHSIQSPNLPDGRYNFKNGYVDVQYSTKVKKINYIQVWYPCRAAGPAHSKYPAYLSLTTNPHAALHGGKSTGTFTNKITDSSDPKAVGDTATVTWTVGRVKFSTAGLSGNLNLAVSGPSTVCPFTLKNKHLAPLNSQGQQQ